MSKLDLLPLACLFALGCVGDSNVTPNDGGADVTTDDSSPKDVNVVDTFVDAPAPACDVTKPFGTVGALASTINNVTRVGWAQLTHDELSMTYSAFNNGSPPIHLMTAIRAAVTDPFTTGTQLAITGTNDDDEPSVTGDNLTLYFGSDRPSKGGYHIWAATRTIASTDFGSPLQVSSLTSAAEDYEPYVSADGTVLYFASTRTGGAGQADLYRAKRPTTGSFTVDTPGPFTAVNSASYEADPVFSADELTLYFASGRTGGSGGTDVWKATRPDTSSAFGAPTNVTELNTTNDDAPSWISDDGCRIYVTRGGLGNYAIYSATKPK